MMKLKLFRRKAIFFPNSLISKGNVIVPIIVNVVRKAATAEIDAPLLRRDAAKGNEMRAGMYRIDPMKATRRIPLNPDCSPTILEILLCGTKPKSNPIKIITIRTLGRMLKNDFTANVSDCFVFALFLIKAITRQPIVKVFMKIPVESNFVTLSFLSIYSAMSPKGYGVADFGNPALYQGAYLPLSNCFMESCK